jgi:hypothetical protein
MQSFVSFEQTAVSAVSQRKIMANRIPNLTLTAQAHAACRMRAGTATGIVKSVLLRPILVRAAATQ